jgi:hypothetical protein
MTRDKGRSPPLQGLVQLKTRPFLRKTVDSSLVKPNLSVVQWPWLQEKGNAPPLSTPTSYSSSPSTGPQSGPGTAAKTKEETEREQWRWMEEGNSALRSACLERRLSLRRLIDSMLVEMSSGVSQSA